MAKKVTEYWIYKKTIGARYPGDLWDGPFTEAAARKKFKQVYGDYDLHGRLLKKQCFRIVKMVTEAVTP